MFPIQIVYVFDSRERCILRMAMFRIHRWPL